MELEWSKEWLVIPGTLPVVSAGPDARYELSGLPPTVVDTLLSWEASGGLEHEPSTPEEEELQTLLVNIGALRPRLPNAPSIGLVSTTPLDELHAALSARAVNVCPPAAHPDLELVVRTNASWPEIESGVHLGVDLTHHHTLVLGPMVIPGITSCLRCLARQTERRWGADNVAPRPRASRWIEVLAELLTIQIDLASTGDVPLINATAYWDFHTGGSGREQLHRAPDCGGPCRAPTADQIHLPWLTT